MFAQHFPGNCLHKNTGQETSFGCRCLLPYFKWSAWKIETHGLRGGLNTFNKRHPEEAACRFAKSDAEIPQQKLLFACQTLFRNHDTSDTPCCNLPNGITLRHPFATADDPLASWLVKASSTTGRFADGLSLCSLPNVGFEPTLSLKACHCTLTLYPRTIKF